MKFKTTHHGSVTVIMPQGNLMGGPDATELNGKVLELLEAGRILVVVDLSMVEFTNSSGLGMLIGSASKVKNAGGKLNIAHASAKILELIRITKLHSILENYPSVEQAVASLKK